MTDFDARIGAVLLGEDEEGSDGLSGGRACCEPGVYILLGTGGSGAMVGLPEPVEEFDGFCDLLLGGVHGSARACVRCCHGPDTPEVVPFCEVFDRFRDFGGQGTESIFDPRFEAAEVDVLIGEETVVYKERPEVVGCPPRHLVMTIEAFVGQRGPPGRDGCQELLNFGGAFPGDDTLGSIGLA